MAGSWPTVLVVDDSPAMLRYLRAFLESESFQVESASSGIDALELLRTGYRPDVLLLDLQMPGIDGLETMRHARALCPGLNVVMCSGVDDPGIAARAVSMGANAYLTKPVQPLYLSAALERCLRQSAAPADNTAHVIVLRARAD